MELPANDVGVLVWVHWTAQLDGPFALVVEAPEISDIHLHWITVADESNCD
jgi:hypothetical protein